jgi:integrase
MGIQSTGRGRDTHLIKITLGYEQGTGKRLYHTETFKGTKKDARLREAELKIQHRDKKLVLSSEMTFSVCFDHYRDEVRSRLSRTCFHVHESFIRLYLIPALQSKKLKDLVREDFQKAYDALSTRGLSPHTVRTLHGAAKGVTTWATGKRLLREDILKGITLPKIPKTRPEFLTYEEMQSFFEAAPDYWYGNAFKFQFFMGVRNQELMALMWEDVDFEAATVLIRRACIWLNRFEGFKCTKTGEERTLELDLQTLNFLKRLKAGQEVYIKSRREGSLSYGDERLIFCTGDGRVPARATVRECFRRILKKIGITRRFRWYGARHTHATHMIDVEGAKPKMIANRMGHSVEMLFRTYGHEMKGQQRDALSKISSRVTL